MGCFPEHPYHAKAGAFALLGFRLTAFAFLPASFLAWSHFAPCCNSEAVRVTANTTAAVTTFSVLGFTGPVCSHLGGHCSNSGDRILTCFLS